MTLYCGFAVSSRFVEALYSQFSKFFFFSFDPFHGFLQYICSLIHWMALERMKGFIHGEYLHYLPLKSSRKDPYALFHAWEELSINIFKAT